MTQPEPTRDPRLLSADQIRGFTNLSDESTLESFNCPPPKFEAKAIRMLLDHIAAKDQRHAALVEACNDYFCFHLLSPESDSQNRARIREALAALAQPPGDE